MKSLPFKLLALAAMLAIQVPAVAQTNGGTAAPAPGTSKQAEYDCSGMTWTARDNCLKLNGQAGETQPAGNLENQSTEKP